MSSSRLNRSRLLTQLSGHLDQFYSLQQAWGEQFRMAQETVGRADEEIRLRDEDIIRTRAETSDQGSKWKKKIASTCKDLCGQIDELKYKIHQESSALEQSKTRLTEQQAMVKQLEMQNVALQSSLDKTMRKFD